MTGRVHRVGQSASSRTRLTAFRRMKLSRFPTELRHWNGSTGRLGRIAGTAAVAAWDSLDVLETDKTENEIPAPISGVVTT